MKLYGLESVHLHRRKLEIAYNPVRAPRPFTCHHFINIPLSFLKCARRPTLFTGILVMSGPIEGSWVDGFHQMGSIGEI